MRVGITKFAVWAAFIALIVLVCNAGAWAQCPGSPNYSADFSANQNCLTVNSSGALATYPGFYSPAGLGNTPPYSNANPAPPPAGVNTVLRLTPNSTYQAGSAWFNTPQQVSGPFTTTFKFQLSGTNTGFGAADGIAFLIQNSALTALGPNGCGIGYGGNSFCTGGNGIPNSLAVEVDTFNNGTPDNNVADHVAIQSCPAMGANTTDLTAGCTVANVNLAASVADGLIHSITMTYTPSTLSNCGGGGTTTCSSIDVILDNTDLTPGGVLFDMTTLGLANGANCANCMAFVGFTASTGGGDDNQDILNWTFTPQSQTTVVTPNAQSTLTFQNANQNNVYDYTAQLNAGGTPVAFQVQPILISRSDCDALVHRSFWSAHCFVFENAEGTGTDSSVLFAVTCPQSNTGGCSGINFGELGTDFEFAQADNPFFVFPGIFGFFNPFPGWLKSSDPAPDPNDPCAIPAQGPLFTSNNIATFTVTGDPGGTTKGKGPSGASCWVATYDTPGELPPGIKITVPKFTTYAQNQVVTASYACNNPITSQPPNNATGPYLTVASCSQSQFPNNQNTNTCNPTANGLACTGPVDTSALGLHVFEVTAVDSGGNANVNVVIYNVRRNR